MFRMRWGGMSLDEINSESYVYGNKAKRGMRAYDQALEFASKA